MFYLGIFIVFEALLIPLAWFKKIKSLLTDLSYLKAGSKKSCECFWIFVAYFLFGLLFEFVYLIIDSFYFTKDCFTAVSIDKLRNNYKLTMN